MTMRISLIEMTEKQQSSYNLLIDQEQGEDDDEDIIDRDDGKVQVIIQSTDQDQEQDGTVRSMTNRDSFRKNMLKVRYDLNDEAFSDFNQLTCSSAQVRFYQLYLFSAQPMLEKSI